MPETPEGLDESYRPVRLNLDLKEADVQFLAQVAEYWNARAAAQKRRFDRNWSRKSLAETFIAKACAAMREELAVMLEACGPFPEIDLEKAKNAKEKARFRREMGAYVRKVLAWQERVQDRAGKK